MTLHVTSAPWICSACGIAISANAGVIELSDRESGRFPTRASPDWPPDEFSDRKEIVREVGTIAEQTELQSSDALWLIEREPNVDVRALHFDCCVPDRQGYTIALSDAASLEAWVAWVLHLQEKSWIGRWDTERLLQFWWQGRGLGLPLV